MNFLCIRKSSGQKSWYKNSSIIGCIRSCLANCWIKLLLQYENGLRRCDEKGVKIDKSPHVKRGQAFGCVDLWIVVNLVCATSWMIYIHLCPCKTVWWRKTCVHKRIISSPDWNFRNLTICILQDHLIDRFYHIIIK